MDTHTAVQCQTLTPPEQNPALGQTHRMTHELLFALEVDLKTEKCTIETIELKLD